MSSSGAVEIRPELGGVADAVRDANAHHKISGRLLAEESACPFEPLAVAVANGFPSLPGVARHVGKNIEPVFLSVLYPSILFMAYSAASFQLSAFSESSPEPIAGCRSLTASSKTKRRPRFRVSAFALVGAEDGFVFRRMSCSVRVDGSPLSGSQFKGSCQLEKGDIRYLFIFAVTENLFEKNQVFEDLLQPGRCLCLTS